MILNALPPERLIDGFDWNYLERWQYRFCWVQRVDYLYEPFMTMYVDSFNSLRHALHSMEEEALMYVVNESTRGRPAEVKDIIPDNDLVIISKNTEISLVAEYESSAIHCWNRLFEHEGDLYQDTDIVLRTDCNIQRYLEINSKVPMVVKIDTPGTDCELGTGLAARISAAIVHSEADKLGLQEQTVHLLKRDKKASTLDILLGMQ